MTTILPPPNRKDFNSEKEYKDSYKKWEKEFSKFMKNEGLK
tara:strand:+ start:357 stop:479 length:123 start_codon:yes stop_codon:yes gene_type:complete